MRFTYLNGTGTSARQLRLAARFLLSTLAGEAFAPIFFTQCPTSTLTGAKVGRAPTAADDTSTQAMQKRLRCGNWSEGI